MRYIINLLFLICFTLSAQAQTASGITSENALGQKTNEPKKQSFVFKKHSTVNFEAIERDFQPTLMVKEMPKQGSKKVEMYNYPSSGESASQKAVSSATIAKPLLGQSFLGNPFGLSVPNDNDLAVSDAGMVVSVINTNIYIKNSVTGLPSPVKSLNAFTSPINNNHQEFDPKVMYDPNTDRFVLMCLVGFVDTTSKVIIGFSQTNNPNGNWNLYSLPGNPLNNNLWTDYPMISLTEKELFLSVNLLYNDSSWQTGFVETLVWQISKDSGYAGNALNTVLHSNIKYNGKAIRNLCPVKGGSQLYSPNMFFVSNRNLASQNDTVFLVNITDTIGAPTGTVTVKALTSNLPYYFPPDGRQYDPSQGLATNDSRNLGAFYENNLIQYVHNTKNPSNNFVTVYYGTISNPLSANPVVNGYYLPNDTMDFAYPNISYAGNSGSDNTAIISFDHTSNLIYAGCSAIQTDGQGTFSKILRIKNGTTYVNLLNSNLERWGDYSGSQRRYNKPGEVWMSGFYAYTYSAGFPRAHAAWIAQLVRDTTILVDTTNYVNIVTQNQPVLEATVFPNPADDTFSVEFTLSKPEYLSFELYDLQGKLIEVLLRDWVKVNQNVFSFKTTSLPKGLYLLKINGNAGAHIEKKISIQ